MAHVGNRNKIPQAEQRKRTAIVRALKDELGMTYTEIGDYLGLHKTSINHIYHSGNSSGTGAARPGNPVWDRSKLLDAGVKWFELYNDVPRWNDWAKKVGQFPSSMTVRKYFGPFDNYQNQVSRRITK